MSSEQVGSAISLPGTNSYIPFYSSDLDVASARNRGHSQGRGEGTRSRHFGRGGRSRGRGHGGHSEINNADATSLTVMSSEQVESAVSLPARNRGHSRGGGGGARSGHFGRGGHSRGRGHGVHSEFNNAGGSSRSGQRNNQPRPTHFLALPLGQHSSLRNRVGCFQSALLNSTNANAIRGLDPSIVVNPRRLHFTLGVMALDLEDEDKPASDNTCIQPRKTIQSALALLQSLRPRLLSALEGGSLDAPLELMGAFEANEGQGRGARVLWVSPKSQDDLRVRADSNSAPDGVGERRKKLARVSEIVHKAFKEAGYITDTRPLKLHCTLINSSYRKGPPSRRRELFSYDDILASDALKNIRTPSATLPGFGFSPEACREADSDRTVEVSLGTYTIREIQLCIMGSHGPEDEYVSVGGISLV